MKIAFIQDYMHDGRCDMSEENSFESISADVKDLYGPQFTLLKINQLHGPAGGWPVVTIGYEGDEEKFYQLLLEDGGIEKEDVDNMIIEKEE